MFMEELQSKRVRIFSPTLHDWHRFLGPNPEAHNTSDNCVSLSKSGANMLGGDTGAGSALGRCAMQEAVQCSSPGKEIRGREGAQLGGEGENLAHMGRWDQR